MIVPMSVNTLTKAKATEMAKEIFAQNVLCIVLGGECRIVGNGGKVLCYGASWEEAIARAKWIKR